MIYYALKINSIPRIEFAFSSETNKYKNIISKRENLIETSYIARGGFTSVFDGREYRIDSNSVCLYMPDMEVVNHDAGNECVRLLDVAFYIEKMEYERFECTTGAEWNEIKAKYKECIILPFKMKFDNMNEDLIKSFYTIIQLQSTPSVSSDLLKVCEWLKVLALIDAETRRLLSLNSEYPSTMIYLNKIERYIQNNYSDRIKLSDVAKEMEISESYLCRIFRENLGETFVSYLNKTRVGKARELLADSKSLSASEIAERVGFCDLRYMNKMFKRYYGVSVRECRRLDGELTLMHKKPWDVEELNEDIYKANRR